MTGLDSHEPSDRLEPMQQRNEGELGGSEGGMSANEKYSYLLPSDHPEAERDDVTIGALWQGFKQHTTAHGIPHVEHSNGIFKLGFWCLISLTMVVGLAYNITAQTILFFSYPVDVTTSLLHEPQPVFPAVTLCNMSPVKKSALTQHGGETTNSSQARRKRRSVSVCDEDWSSYSSHCYWPSNGTSSHGDAEKQCSTYGGHLAIISSSGEQTFIQSISTSWNNEEYWVGLRKTSGTWEWLDGSSITYSKWAWSEPDGSGNCGRIAEFGNWRDMTCSSLYWFVCEKSATELTTEGSTEADTTSRGFTTSTDVTTSQSVTTSTEVTTSQSVTTSTEVTTSTDATTSQSVTTSSEVTMSQPFTMSSDVTTETQTAEPLEETSSEPSDMSSPLTPTSSDPSTVSAESPSPTTVSVTSSPTDEATSQPEGSSEDPAAECCCTCCMSPLYTSSCDTCSSMTSFCTAPPTKPPTTSGPPTTTMPTITTTITPPPPVHVNGSKFPDRVEPREDFQKESSFIEELAAVDTKDKMLMGFSADDFIVDCMYNGVACYSSEFTMFSNPVHGNCYIFNSGWNESKRLHYSSSIGRRHGLHVILDIRQDEYVPEVGDTAGARLLVLPQRLMPFPEDEGITVAPGHSTSIGLRQLRISRKSHPYGTCLDDTKSTASINAYQQHHNIIYSSMACQKTCYQRYIVAACGCGDPLYPLSGSFLPDGNTLPCLSTNVTQADCRFEVGLLLKNTTLTCDCPNSCKDTLYSLDVSLGEWPASIALNSILEKVSAKLGDRVLQPEYNLKANLIKAEIYFEEFNLELIVERPKYTDVSYLSDLGGVLGLWVGFSLMTIFEFLELAMDILVWLAASRYRKKMSHSRVQEIQLKPSPSEIEAPDHRNEKINLEDQRPEHDPFFMPCFLLQEKDQVRLDDDVGGETDRRSLPPPYSSRPSSVQRPPGVQRKAWVRRAAKHN